MYLIKNDEFHVPKLCNGARFSKLPVITGPIELFCFPLRMGVSKVLNSTVKLSAKESKCTSSEVRTLPTFLETLISKHDFGPVKLPGLSRNGPPATKRHHSKMFPCVIQLSKESVLTKLLLMNGLKGLQVFPVLVNCGGGRKQSR